MKILFISHDAYRAGAQLLLLKFLKWAKLNSKFDFDILLIKGGELESEFKDLACVYYWSNTKKNILFRFFCLVKNKLLFYKIKKNKYDLLYSNTIANGYFLDFLSEKKIQTITHVHELSFWFNKLGCENFNLNIKNTNIFLAASDAVRLELIKRGVNEKLINVVYEFTEDNTKDYTSYLLHDFLKINRSAKIIGACGGEIWRKGKDLFIPLAEKTLSNNNLEIEIHFVWIGGELNDSIIEDFRASPYKSKIHFISHLPNASIYFNDFSAFVMLSREDPFPVVNLEAGIRKVPVFAFNESGGSIELLSNWPELIVPRDNLDVFSYRILMLLYDESNRVKIGNQLSDHINKNYTIDVIAPKIIDLIYNVGKR